MSLVNQTNRKSVKMFLIVVSLAILLLYLVFDFYLKSVGHELLLSWAKSEAIAIQEGNLLTSTTKNQRVLLSSDYIKEVKLVKIENNMVADRAHFGDQFEIAQNDIPTVESEVTTQRVGFLHYRAFYRIPSRDNMYMIFDVHSKILSYAFLGLITLFLLMIGFLILSIRKVEKTESVRREEMLKQVINDFTSKDKISDLVIKEFPKLSVWWRNKQLQIDSAEQLAIKSQSKALLSEIASRVGHDIGGAMSNIEILTAEMNGLSEKHATALSSSINKVKAIAADIMHKTKVEIHEEKSASIFMSHEEVELNAVIREIKAKKSVLFENDIKFQFLSNNEKIILKNIDGLDLERSISNIVNNAIEASDNKNSEISILVKANDKSVEIKINDSGCGIDPDNLKKIGMKGFTQGKTNGNGIGIYYAKQFIESLGGVFSVQSAVGQGTTVSMVLFN